MQHLWYRHVLLALRSVADAGTGDAISEAGGAGGLRQVSSRPLSPNDVLEIRGSVHQSCDLAAVIRTAACTQCVNFRRWTDRNWFL